jgi:putative acetyltransferase
MDIKIRPEKPSDREAVYAIHCAAFGGSAEAELANALRTAASPLVSLVAEIDSEVAGHILFSPAVMENHPETKIMGLAPLGVLPGLQRRGVGSALIGAGLEACRAIGASAVIVLGYPDYYPRFGFVPSSRFGISSEYDVPEEVFMVIELRPDGLAGRSGRVLYHEIFKTFE